MRHLLAALILLVGVAPAYAEMEKLALPCQTGVCFHWWPKLPPVAGWHHDREQSLYYSFNAQAPDGGSFARAETVIYAQALFKPSVADKQDLPTLVASERAHIEKEFPGIVVKEVEAVVTADGQKLRSFSYSPTASGRWEQVSYGEEEPFYLIFSVSSLTKGGLADAIDDYKKFINHYPSPP